MTKKEAIKLIDKQNRIIKKLEKQLKDALKDKQNRIIKKLEKQLEDALKDNISEQYENGCSYDGLLGCTGLFSSRGGGGAPRP